VAIFIDFACKGTATSSVSESDNRGRGAISICAGELLQGFVFFNTRKLTTRRESMKKLLLLPLVAIGLALVPGKQADAQVSIGVGPVGFGGVGYPAYRYSYYGYPGYYGYYPRSYYGGYPYYRTYYYTGRPYYYSGHRYNKHHRHYYYRY